MICFWWHQNKRGLLRCSRVGSLSVAGGTGNEAPQTSPTSADARFSLLWARSTHAAAAEAFCVAGRERGPIGERAKTPVGLGSRSGSERKKGRGGGRTDKGKTPPPPYLGGDGATAQPRRGATAQRPHHASPAVAHACHCHLRKRRRLPPPRPTSSAKTGATKTCQNLVAIIDATSAIKVLKV